MATTVGDAASLTEWTSGRLVFRNTPVSDALRTLEHWYGRRFVLVDSVLARQHLSATFDYGREDDMLNALRTLLDVTLSFDGDVITVRPRGTLAVPASSRRAVRDSMVHPQASEVGR
jgi:transmembrane sensor